MKEPDPAPEREPDVEPARQSDLRPLVLMSDDLFQGRSEIWINHQGAMYRLRRTGSGKMLLSK
ncbi:hemin uptake protein HemP [Stieleria varia]|uniref:hemin uptake protein HemP n=1 Tax=Stieleria varia TaxID=2528005 RepID=UPI0011B63748|nr:hemin uptake protein HemP [Stieleria varia]